MTQDELCFVLKKINRYVHFHPKKPLKIYYFGYCEIYSAIVRICHFKISQQIPLQVPANSTYDAAIVPYARFISIIACFCCLLNFYNFYMLTLFFSRIMPEMDFQNFPVLCYQVLLLSSKVFSNTLLF